MARAHTGLIGAAGEYYVAAELSRHDWLATVTIKNSPGTDVLAQQLDTGTLISVQTKTATGTSFTLNAKDERVTTTPNEWYALVSLGQLGERPRFFLVPRNHIAAYLFVSHRDWLRKPARRGLTRNDSSRRGLSALNLKHYEEQWEWLRRPTTEVPYPDPEQWLIPTAREVGLPPGHPDAHMLS